MATTPNFGWVTPAPTDFVTDLPADFETFADAVDADVQLIKNTADAALPETLIDAAGDLIYGSAADTAARLAIGTAGQVLAVNSGATAPEWVTASSGGMTLLASGSLSGASTSITSIPTTYTDLQVRFFGVGQVGSSQINMRFGGQTAEYGIVINSNATGSTVSGTTQVGVIGETVARISANIAVLTSASNHFYIVFPSYSKSSVVKTFYGNGIIESTSSYRRSIHFSGYNLNQTGAITEVEILSSSSTFNSGTYEIWGVK